jgi:DNA-binding MarR family transcriptional regulator
MVEHPSFDFESAGDSVAARAGAGLAKIGMALKSRAWRDAGPEHLTPTQGQTLVVLRNAQRGMRLDDIATALGVTAPTASDAVKALVQKKLVIRKNATDDRRAVAVTLTARGTALADRVAGWPDFLLRALDTLDNDEQTGFLRSLIKIIRGLQDAGDIPLQRMCVGCRFFRPHMHDDPARPHHCAFVDAPFGDRHLRLDCNEYEQAAPDAARVNWRSWSGGAPVSRVEGPI